MTKRDRVFTALEHKTPDRVPYTVEFTSEQLQQTLNAYSMDKAEFFRHLGNHCEKVSYNIGGYTQKEGFFTDEFGVVWDRSGLDKDIGVIQENRISSTVDKTYLFPEVNVDAIKKSTEQAIQQRGDTVLFGKIGMAYFERAWSLCGFQNLLMYMALEPDFVSDLFEKILNYNLTIIKTAVQYDIDGFYFGDDYGQQSGLLMSPDMWRTLIKPGLAKMFSVIKNENKYIALHSCGDVTSILPDLIDIGLDIYQTVQPEIYDFAQLKLDFGEKLSFWGGIGTQSDLPNLTSDDLHDTIHKTLQTLGKNGGYIAGPTHRMPADISVDNVRVLIDILVNQ